MAPKVKDHTMINYSRDIQFTQTESSLRVGSNAFVCRWNFIGPNDLSQETDVMQDPP